MSIINNANPGSQIPLTCMIYRVLSRNNGQLTVTEITELCRPANLGVNKNQREKFGMELEFWMREEHQLWYLDSDERLCLVNSQTQLTPRSIAVMINSVLYTSKIKNLFGKNEHDAQDFFKYMSCILSQERYLTYSSEVLESSELATVCKYLPKTPNTNEQGTLLEYGVFLGFLEQLGRGYVVDPTRAITGVLPQIFSDAKELTAIEFVTGLAKSLPLLDGGVYRLAVEEEMKNRGWEHEASPNQLSKTVSHAVERLRIGKVIDVKERADDQDAVYLQVPNQESPFSKVSLRK